jgi:Raf kinase inhibitor-like YbhB/YbcL family protein
MALILKSTAFENGTGIPGQYTCQGDDISPPLRWENTAGTATSLVLIVDDPDAPDPKAPKMTWVHWLLYNIPPDTNGLAEHMTTDKLPAGTKEGLNDWKRTGYGGPCPPIGRTYQQ